MKKSTIKLTFSILYVRIYIKGGEVKLTQLDYLKEKYGEHLLFVGLRGSHCLGLTLETSDVDYLAIVDFETTKCKELQNDTAVYGINLAHERILNGSFNFVEALTSPVYCSDDFNLRSYLNIFDTEEYEYCFKYHIWGYIKNLLKLYDKKDDNRKFGAKIILFYKLFTEYSNIIGYYKSHKLPQELGDLYFRIRGFGLTEEDKLLIEEIRKWREDRAIKQQTKDDCNYYTFLINQQFKEV